MTDPPGRIDLHGDPATRGRAQAALEPESIAPVRALVAGRLHGARALLARPHVRRFLVAQWDFCARHDPEGLAEMQGIAAGYGLDPAELFAFLHAGQLAGLPDDGCTAWAFAHPDHGAILVKNRDLRGPALPLQRVFLHLDPAWGTRRVLCVGSLGAPGAYSSGINSDGFSLVDTQVVTTDQGVGMLRYFLMTRLLARCATVEQAIGELHATRHAGGGTLVLADRTGAMAAVEIGHSHVGVDRPAGLWVARTNHFLDPALRDRLLAARDSPGLDVSHGRLAAVSEWLGTRQACPTENEAAAIMASHDRPGATGLCRHGANGGSSTVSCAIFACGAGTLYFAHGNPCDGAWRRFGMPAHPD
jgi:isopenicillin-N N-acyltransferase-like protein